MAKKYLYLGNNKWCYTPNCSEHASLTKTKNHLEKALLNNNTKHIAKLSEELQQTEEGKAVLYETLTRTHAVNLGRKPILGLDLDGTVADFTNGLRWHMATKDGIQIDSSQWEKIYPDPDNYDYHQGNKAWFKSREEFLENFFAAEKRGIYRNLRIFDGAQSTLRDLNNYGFHIKAVTARNAVFNEDTRHWLKTKQIPAKKIYNPGHAKETVQVDVYADDAPVVVNRLIEHEKKVLILNQEYNQNGVVKEVPGQTHRAQNWQDGVVEKIFDLLLPKKD